MSHRGNSGKDIQWNEVKYCTSVGSDFVISSENFYCQIVTKLIPVQLFSKF